MEYSLLTVYTGVGDHAETGFRNAKRACGLLNALVNLQQIGCVVFGDLQDAFDVLLRDDQRVNRCDRVDVMAKMPMSLVMVPQPMPLPTQPVTPAKVCWPALASARCLAWPPH